MQVLVDSSQFEVNKLSPRTAWRVDPVTGEPVWPPELEIWLIRGLETLAQCRGQEKKCPELGRDKFLANYIKESTKIKRTAKQVSSRLQQIRRQGEDEYLISLINNTSSRRRAVKKCVKKCRKKTKIDILGFISPGIPERVSPSSSPLASEPSPCGSTSMSIETDNFPSWQAPQLSIAPEPGWGIGNDVPTEFNQWDHEALSSSHAYVDSFNDNSDPYLFNPDIFPPLLYHNDNLWEAVDPHHYLTTPRYLADYILEQNFSLQQNT